MDIRDGVTHCIHDGDYFYYSWKTGKQPATDPYWCRDRKCVARINPEGEIELVDTYNYWKYNDAEGTLFSYDGLVREYSRFVTEEKFDLEFICNVDDVEVIDAWEKEDYDKVYNLSYQVGYNKLFAIDKGMAKSQSAILKKLQGKLEEAEYQKKSAEWDIERIQRAIQEMGHEL